MCEREPGSRRYRASAWIQARGGGRSPRFPRHPPGSPRSSTSQHPSGEHEWPPARRPPADGSSSSSRRRRRAPSPATSARTSTSRRAVGHIRDLPAAERAARGDEEGPVRQVRGRRRQRLRGLLRRRHRQEEEGRRAQAGAQGRRRALPRHRRGPRGRGHRLAPARGAEAQGPGPADGLPRDHPGGHPARSAGHPRSRRAAGRRAGDPADPRPALRLRGLARCCGARSAPGLSAGRVQSVATRLVVERERERMAFRSASYWDVVGAFAPAARRPTGRRRSGVHRPAGGRRRRLGSRPAGTSTTAGY